LIYGLFALKKAGGGKLLLGPEQSQTSACDKPIMQDSFNLLEPLLRHQDYIQAEFAPHYRPIMFDLNRFRTHWNDPKIRSATGITLLSEMHFYALGIQQEFRHDEPWLKVPDPIETGKFTVHRSARYRNEEFNWEAILKFFGARNMLFVGLPDEHREFSSLFSCNIPYHKPKDFLELARIIAGSKGFIGNQSFPCSIAIGCGQRILQEAWQNSPDCAFLRNNLMPYLSGKMWTYEVMEKWASSSMRLPLPTVTLLGIDTARPLITLAAMKRTLGSIQPGKSILLTDTEKHPNIAAIAATSSIEVRHHTQRDVSVTFPGTGRRFFIDYEMAVMTEPLKHIGESSHVLYMESDGGVVQAASWDPDFLLYDYIGAPWGAHNDVGWPACDGVTNAVGNSGFSLMSRKFCEKLSIALNERSTDPARFSCDRWMCRTIRPWMDHHGVKYAPVSVASKFSCENQKWSGSFGFHGRSTAALNRWHFVK